MKWLKKKNASASATVGLAVEPEGLTAVAVRWIDDVLRIDDLVFLSPSAETPARVALKSWVSSRGLSDARCYPVISPDEMAIYQIDRPSVADDELEDAARWQIKDRIDFDLTDAVVDTFAYPTDAMRSNQSIVNVVVSRKSAVQRIVDCVRFAGLSLEAIDVPELAVRNVVSLYAEEDRSIALLTLDETTGTILLYKNDHLYLSRNINASVLSDHVDNEGELDQLCLEVQRSLDYFESQLGQASPRRILVYATTGSERLSLAIGNTLNVETKVLDLNRLGIEVGSRELDESQRVSSVRAVGAALRQEQR